MPSAADQRNARGSLLPRIGRAWRALDPDSRLAACSSLALFVTMFLPWYQQNLVTSGSRSRLESQNLSAFGVFSFIEAAVLLVALAVLVLLFARAERRAFHLPGGDGTIVTAAGGWCVALLVWRLFDKPDISGSATAGNVGVQWGIFFALGAAGLLLYAGLRLRSAARPEPPLLIEGRIARRAPAPGTEVTQVLPAEPRPDEAPTERIPDGDAPTERLDD